MFKINIGERIKERRKLMGLSQEQLSNLIDVSSITVRRWEANERTPNSSLIPKLAEALNTSVPYLMGFDIENKDNADTLQSEKMKDISFVRGVDFIGSGRVLMYEKAGQRFVLPATPENQIWFRDFMSNAANDKPIPSVDNKMAQISQ